MEQKGVLRFILFYDVVYVALSTGVKTDTNDPTYQLQSTSRFECDDRLKSHVIFIQLNP